MYGKGYKIDHAVKFLIDCLTGKEMPSTEVFRLSKEAGIAKRTYDRARSIIGAKTRFVDGRWYMSLGEDVSEGFVYISRETSSHKLSIDWQPDLPIMYIENQRQAEISGLVEVQRFNISDMKRVFLMCGSSRFYGKFDGFSLRVPQALENSMMAGDAFVFCNWSKNQICVLQWQGDGFAQYFKRSDCGQFPWPTKKAVQAIEILPQDLRMLLEYPKLMLRLSGAFSPEFSTEKTANIAGFA